MPSSWTITEIDNGQPTTTVSGVSQKDAIAAIYRAMRGESPLPAAAARREPVQASAERREQVAAAA